MYGPGDVARPISEVHTKPPEPYRSEWRRDHARLIHSPSFRRLQGKTQVFAGSESDFFRNRLTHSLEVAQIAKSIAIRLNATSPFFKRRSDKIEPDIVEFAALAHDLGHPPFGHNGEVALDEQMADYGGFEGNAQALRIISKLEKKTTSSLVNGRIRSFALSGEDLRSGLNLTYRSLASVLKYDRVIPERAGDREKPNEVMKGYYHDAEDLVAEIKRHVIGSEEVDGPFKTIECSIMDIADDIAYSTYDLEGIFKSGFLSPMRLLSLDDEVYENVADTIRGRINKQYSDDPEMISFAKTMSIADVKGILFGIFDTHVFRMTWARLI
jgi:dGTPase